MTDSSAAPSAGADGGVHKRGAVIQMAAGAALLSSTSLFVVYAHVAPTVSGFYRMLFGGGMLLAWVVLSGGWRPLAWRDVWLALLLRQVSPPI